MRRRKAIVVQNPRRKSDGLQGASSAVPKPGTAKHHGQAGRIPRAPGITRGQKRRLRELTRSPIPKGMNQQLAKRAIGLLEAGRTVPITRNGQVVATLKPIPRSERKAHKSQRRQIYQLTDDLSNEFLTRGEAEVLIKALSSGEPVTLTRGTTIKTYRPNRPSSGD